MKLANELDVEEEEEEVGGDDEEVEEDDDEGAEAEEEDHRGGELLLADGSRWEPEWISRLCATEEAIPLTNGRAETAEGEA